jgi:hypothetical protein
MPYVASIGTDLPGSGTPANEWLGDAPATDAVSSAQPPKQAIALAALTLSDVHVAEVHDFDTGVEIIGYEDLGFLEGFEADKVREAGARASVGDRQ